MMYQNDVYIRTLRTVYRVSNRILLLKLFTQKATRYKSNHDKASSLKTTINF